ncbi:rhomboid family intramembrane serine protease [Sediminitomix flava]|nr:rhomboid family intramembrane serine protease [Sediminitomix flava]
MLSITIILIISIGLVSWQGFQKPQLKQKLMHSPYKVSHNKEYYRFVTSGWVHADWTHLLFNLFTLYFFGRNTEMYFTYILDNPLHGKLATLALFTLGVIISDIPTYIKHKNDYWYGSLGASGGVSAMIFTSILYDPTNTIYLYFIPIPGFIFGFLYLIYSNMQAKRGRDNINHDAHFYGAVFGIVYGAALYPESLTQFVHKISQFSLF